MLSLKNVRTTRWKMSGVRSQVQRFVRQRNTVHIQRQRPHRLVHLDRSSIKLNSPSTGTLLP